MFMPVVSCSPEPLQRLDFVFVHHPDTFQVHDTKLELRLDETFLGGSLAVLESLEFILLDTLAGEVERAEVVECLRVCGIRMARENSVGLLELAIFVGLDAFNKMRRVGRESRLCRERKCGAGSQLPESLA